MDFGKEISNHEKKSFLIKQRVTVYEAGVEIVQGKQVHKLHFSEIEGLEDTGDATTLVPVGGGVAGAVVAGLVTAVLDAKSDHSRRKNRLRDISIHPKNGKRIDVVETAGDALSEAYTIWMINTNEISASTLRSLRLPFGERLELEFGVLHELNRRGDRKRSVDLTNLRSIQVDSNAPVLHLGGINEKGKERGLIALELKHLANLDLLYYIVELAVSNR